MVKVKEALHAYHIAAHKQMAAAAAATDAAANTGAKATAERSGLLRFYFFTLLDCDFLRSSSRCSTFGRNAHFFTD